MGLLAEIILAPGRLTQRYAEGVLKDIKPEQFARLAVCDGKPVQSNHPAFVFGHLSLYAPKVMPLLNQPPLANPPKFEELFANKQPCLDDPEGTIYPPMDAILNHYRVGYETAMAAVGRASDAEMAKPNPTEGRMKEMFPTVGAIVNFHLTAHPMSHLGQVSAWRRMMGLGSAF